ncbi:MAG: ferritin-like domain-containing protein [Myxococcales bacterium]|jgi:hypothetical protein|nr:ferritin-like domain-containing protein [Myxococcales bacterium]
MNANRLSWIMRMVLATAAGAAGAAACGGAVSDGAGGGATTGRDADPDTGLPKSDAGGDAARGDVFVPFDAPVADVFQGCKTGTIPFDATYCCEDAGSPGCFSGGGGDGACALDCARICEGVVPGSAQVAEYCSVDPTGTTINYACGACGVGRVPSALAPCDRGGSVAERLAMQAYYEAASALAFADLAAALGRAGAPADLIAAAEKARVDEIAHARAFARLARDRGAIARDVELTESPRDLLAMALENAGEGCVRETYGALVALHQAAHAADPDVRAAFARTAADEIEHAALSWRLAAWFDGQLDAEGRARVRAAHASARAALRPVAERDAVDVALGMPSPELGARLFDDLFAAMGDSALAA